MKIVFKIASGKQKRTDKEVTLESGAKTLSWDLAGEVDLKKIDYMEFWVVEPDDVKLTVKKVALTAATAPAAGN